MSKKLFLFFLLLMGATLTFTACKDECEKKDCGNGTCLEGTCECDAGYEYDEDGSCKVESRAKLIGTFSTTEQCSTDPMPLPYVITISAGTSITDINIFNFYGSFSNTAVRATVSGTTITVPSQNPGNGPINVSGSGTITPSNAAGKVEISLTYTVVDQGPMPAPTATCTNTVFLKQQ